MASIIRRVDLRGKRFDSTRANELVPRAAVDISMAVGQIKPLLEDVRARGEAAVVQVTVERDGVDPRPIRVETNELEAALASLDPKLKTCLLYTSDAADD